jgi:ribosome-binding factor A
MAKDLFDSVRSRKGSPQGKSSRKELEQLVAETRPDDGVDPRLAARRKRHDLNRERPGRSHGEHKQAQLFSQVHDAVDAALLAARQPMLNSLSVRDVTLTGGSFVIVVQPRDPAERIDATAATAALESANSMLRREVAASISRKETPALRFVVLPAAIDDAET